LWNLSHVRDDLQHEDQAVAADPERLPRAASALSAERANGLLHAASRLLPDDDRRLRARRVHERLFHRVRFLRWSFFHRFELFFLRRQSGGAFAEQRDAEHVPGNAAAAPRDVEADPRRQHGAGQAEHAEAD
jgi:hypothetical protein